MTASSPKTEPCGGHPDPSSTDLLGSEASRVRAAVAASALDAALGAIGDRWSLGVIRSAFLGARRFDQFLQHLEVPRQTLSNRLKDLKTLGILLPQAYQVNPVRLAYRLSPAGLALYPNALASWKWERRWAMGPGTMPLPRTLHHRSCAHLFEPVCICATCRTAVQTDDLEFELVAEAASERRAYRPRRWSHRAAARPDPAIALAFGLSVDRWALLIIAAVMLGCRRFDALQAALGVGSSVLANRLELLCRSGLLARRDDPADRRRVVYALTAPSHDLLPCLLTLSAWGREQLTQGADTIAIKHRLCGRPLQPLMACSHCAGELHPKAVTFTW